MFIVKVMQVELAIKTIRATMSDYKNHMDLITASATGGVCVKTEHATVTITTGLSDVMRNY